FLGRAGQAVLRFECALPGQGAVPVVTGDPEVDVAVGDVGGAAGDEAGDELDDLGDVLRHAGHVVRHSEPERGNVLQVPFRRGVGEVCARARGRQVDLVIDIGDVVHEGDDAAGCPQPPGQPHAKDEGTRVARVRPRVDGRPAE